MVAVRCGAYTVLYAFCLGLAGLTRIIEWFGFAFGRRALRGYIAGSLSLVRVLYRAYRPHMRAIRWFMVA